MSAPALRDAINRPVRPEEVRAAAHGVIPDAERGEALALIRWFTTRYPTAQDRLAYIRAAYARWRAVTRVG